MPLPHVLLYRVPSYPLTPLTRPLQQATTNSEHVHPAGGVPAEPPFLLLPSRLGAVLTFDFQFLYFL